MSAHEHNWLRLFATLLLAATTAAAQAQSATPQTPQISPQVQTQAQPQTAQPANPQQAGAAQPGAQPPAKPTKLPTAKDRREAARLYMQAASLYQAQQFENALDLDRKAAALDPTNPDYNLAAEIARSHAVTALIQQATHDQIQGHTADQRAALSRALALDPQNPTIADHIRALADQQANSSALTSSEIQDLLKPPALAPPLQVFPKTGTQSFHVHTGQRQIIQQVFSAFGVNATVDNSVRNQPARFDIDDATFAEAVRALDMVTNSFYVPIDAHRVLVARDTVANRMQFGRSAVDTIPLSGLSPNDMTEIGNIARNVFLLRQMSVDPNAAAITLRGPVETLNAFTATYQDLLEGRSQVLLDVRVIQLAHTHQRNIGVQPPQTITAFNVYSEEQSILNQNAALVQQIISSGLASPGDTLAILGILIASGQVSSSLFQNGLVLFGGGITQSALVPGGPLTVNLSLNSSESRALDDYRIRLEDGEEGTLKSGSRYPIITSSFSSAGAGSLNIPGLNLPGTSGSLGSLLSSLQGATPTIPQFQYQDLGLVLKARPRVLRSGDVAMTLDIKITALAGSSLNNVPVLANRAYTGAVTVPADQGVVLAAEIDKNEMRAISGWPGLSEIPGLNNVTDKSVQTNTSTLLIIITPHLVRSPHLAGHSPMLRVESAPGIR
jgi:tetratricopeptide (TPR) repeat protein